MLKIARVLPVDSTRQEWEEGHRRIDAEPDRRARARLLEQVDLVRDELRRRIGQTFTLAELDQAYRDADAWAAAVIAEPRSAAVITAAAFHLYSRGAVDYAP
jgi:deoxyinosine 3'endonuclease (endonuclease V)